MRFIDVKNSPDILLSMKNSDTLTITCDSCNNECKKTKHRLGQAIKNGYLRMCCSVTCKKNFVTCDTCSTKFNRPQAEVRKTNFCSKDCYAKFKTNEFHGKPPSKLIKKCRKCSSRYVVEPGVSSYHKCASCLAEQRKYKFRCMGLTKGHYKNLPSVNGKSFPPMNPHIRLLCKFWNKNLTALPCQKCGYSKHIELCHIKSVASFPDDALLGEINNPNNILVLCRNCHWEFDNGLLTITDIPQRLMMGNEAFL